MRPKAPGAVLEFPCFPHRIIFALLAIPFESSRFAFSIATWLCTTMQEAIEGVTSMLPNVHHPIGDHRSLCLSKCRISVPGKIRG